MRWPLGKPAIKPKPHHRFPSFQAPSTQRTQELKRAFADPKKDQFSSRNVVPRIIFRSLSIVVATLLAAMLPFFRDMVALLGAFACTSLDFILPMVFYNVTFKPSKKTIIFWVNTSIAVISTMLSLAGAVASVRQIVLDAKTYPLFSNV